jgi:UDP-N-acetylglucosamine 2-epimerase (non-hydrolysing)
MTLAPKETSPVLAIVGTRPEAIKMAPLLLEAGRAAPGLAFELVLTGQHGLVVTEALSAFGLCPNHVLDCVRPTGTLPELLSILVANIGVLVRRVRPVAVVVQGDTTTALAGALAAFYEHVPVVHLEAGLETKTVQSPFPEEAHRRLISEIARLHLAPTSGAATNLVDRGVDPDHVVITGNTVVDSLQHVVNSRYVNLRADVAAFIGGHQHVVVVTAHRRESWGRPMAEIARSLITLTERHADAVIVVVRHPNPNVDETMAGYLDASARILCIDPLPYPEFVTLLARSCLVLTDSGGLQEELPSLGVPTVVLRSETERPEAVFAGTSVLAGTDHDRIIELASAALLLVRTEAVPVNPFGDGEAGRRAVEAIVWMLGRGGRPPDYQRPSVVDVSVGDVWLEPVLLGTPAAPA